MKKFAFQVALLLAFLFVPSTGRADVCGGIDQDASTATMAFLLVTAVPAILAPDGMIDFNLGIATDLNRAEAIDSIAFGGQNVMTFGRFEGVFTAHFGSQTACNPVAPYHALTAGFGYRLIDTDRFETSVHIGPEFALPGSFGFGLGVDATFHANDWFNVSLRIAPGYLSASDKMEGFHLLSTLPVEVQVSKIFGLVFAPFLSFAEIRFDQTRTDAGGMIGFRFTH